MRMRQIPLRLLMCILLMLSACSLFEGGATDSEVIAEKQEPEYLSHKISTEGETLGLIAEWYTGSASKWKEIAAFNNNLNARAIKVGQTIKIPAALVKNKKPLTAEAVSNRLQTGVYSTASYEEPTVGEGEPNEEEIQRAMETAFQEDDSMVLEDYDDVPAPAPVVQEVPAAPAPRERPSLPFRTYQAEGNKTNSLQLDEETTKALQRKDRSAEEQQRQEDVKKLLKSREEYLQQLLEE